MSHARAVRPTSVRPTAGARDIRTYHRRLVLVPEEQLVSSQVTNDSASPRRSAKVLVYVGDGTGLEQVLDVVLEAVRAAIIAVLPAAGIGPPDRNVRVRVSRATLPSGAPPAA